MSEPAPEFSRIIKLSDLGGAPLVDQTTAGDDECEALAKRFDLPEIQSMTAEYQLDLQNNKILFSGTLHSSLTQSCAISGEDFPVTISETFSINFMETGTLGTGDEPEVELESEDCDIIEYAGNAIDIGEALAQTLYLALDPYAEGPNAHAIRNSGNLKTEEESGPFAALAALKDKLS